MRTLTYVANEDNIVVKNVLRSHFKLASSLITLLKTSGGIKLNGEVVTVRKIMNREDTLTLTFPEDKSSDILPVQGELDILYEDEDILCVNKPSGMPTHPSQNHHSDTLANLVCHYYRDKKFTFRVSNRLDSYTSGVVIIAKNVYSASFLCTNEFRRTMKKTYFAICRGTFDEKNGTVVAPIARADGSTIKREVSLDGQYAETDYTVVSEKNNLSLVKLTPKTGRTHQIRVHMAHISHPLANDFLYDENSDGTSVFYLHCAKMEFTHPVSGIRMEIDADLPDINFN